MVDIPTNEQDIPLLIRLASEISSMLEAMLERLLIC